MSRVADLLFVSLTLSLTVGFSQAQSRSPGAADLSWARDFAAQGGQHAGARNATDIKWDPNFRALMQASFHQQQRFWLDHGRFPSVPDLITVFLGIPGKVTLDEDRYVTADGCVPHDCGDSGMVWLDTASNGKPKVIFAVPEQISGGPDERGSQLHLWLFASTHLDGQALPQPFTTRLGRWYGAYRAIWQKDYDMRVTLVTLVQSNGQTVDLSPALFPLGPEALIQHN